MVGENHKKIQMKISHYYRRSATETFWG